MFCIPVIFALQRILDMILLVEMMTLSRVKLGINWHQRRILLDFTQELTGYVRGNDTVLFTMEHLHKKEP